MQKLLTLILTGAILYMIFKHNINDIKNPAPEYPSAPTDSSKPITDEQPNGTLVEKTISSILINVLKTDQGKMFLENILQPINKPIAGSDEGFKVNNNNLIDAMFDIKTFGEGVEGAAICGHVVTVSYKILTPNNIVVSENTATYPLGSNQIAPLVDAVIVGMKVGQTRNAMISSKYIDQELSSGKSAESFKVSVLLKNIMPQNFVGDNVKVFDDEIAYKLPLLCGNKAVYHAKVTKLASGKVLYDSKSSGNKLNMQIGNLSYPVIFSYALHNKIPVGTRVVIAPGKLFKSFITESSTIFLDTQLNEDEFFMLELYEFENIATNYSSKLPINK